MTSPTPPISPTQPHVYSDSPTFVQRRARALIGWMPVAGTTIQ